MIRVFSLFVLVLGVGATFSLSFFGREYGVSTWANPSIDLSGAQLSERPQDWADRTSAEANFRREWCNKNQREFALCVANPDQFQFEARTRWCIDRKISDCSNYFREAEAEFQAEWSIYRSNYIESLNLPKFAGADFREAFFFEAFLPGADLSFSSLEGSNFSRAYLEAASFRRARMEGANFFRAQMEEADLSEAIMDGAVFSRAQVEGATLIRAKIKGAIFFRTDVEGADFREAEVGGSNFFRADLSSADFGDANIGASLLSSADFSDAKSLTQFQLDTAIGDEATILPKDEFTGAQLFVWSCWAEEPAAIVGLLATFPEFEHNRLRNEWLCNGRPRARTGQTECGTPITNDNYDKPDLLRCG